MDYGKKIQIHNFVVLKYKIDKASFIKVSTVAGDWSVLYREDSIMYLTIDMADESQYEGIYNVMVGMYGACNTVDQEFTKELFGALHRFYERLKSKQAAVLEEENAKVLEDEKRFFELKEEISRDGKDDNGNTPVEGRNG